MAVQVWIGEKPEHPNERRAIVALANGLERLDGLYLILANFSVGGRTIDLVLIKQDAIFIIELKQCDGKVFGGVNGPWFIESANGERKRLNPGRKNPYNQVISYYYSIINFLNEQRVNFLSPQKSTSVDFRTCKRLVVIAPTIQEGSQIDTDWKVEVRGLDELPAYLVTERSSEIDLSEEEMLAIPELLGCTRWNEVNSLLVGVMPNWNQIEAQVPVPAVEPVAAEPAAPAAKASWFERIGVWMQRPQLRAATIVLLLVVLLAGVWTFRPRATVRPDQANTVLLSTSAPAGGIGMPLFDEPESCVWSGFQAIGRRYDGQAWKTVGVMGTAPDLAPHVVVTLDEVSFCEGQIQLSWSVQNNFSNQSVRLPLDNSNIVITDSLGNTYLLDEQQSKPNEIMVEPNSRARGVAVIDRSASLNAQTLVVRVQSQPFGNTTWLVPLQNTPR